MKICDVYIILALHVSVSFIDDGTGGVYIWLQRESIATLRKASNIVQFFSLNDVTSFT